MDLFKRLDMSDVDGRSQAGRRRGGYAALLAILVVLHLCKVAAFVAAGQGLLLSDAGVYWSLGHRILAGDWLLAADPPEVTRTPGYPYFVALFQATCGERALAAAVIAQHLLLLASVVLTTWICWRLNKRRSSVLFCLALSLACFSCHGVGVLLVSDSLLCFLLTLCIVTAIAWQQSPSKSGAVAIGLALGAAIMVKPVTQYAWLLVCGWMLADPRSGLSWRKRTASCGLVIVGTLVFVAPWLIRNEICLGRPFLTKFAGRSLWWSCFKGNPADNVDPPIPFGEGPATRTIRQSVPAVDPHDTWKTFKTMVRLGYSESAADDLMLQGAKEAVIAHPWQYIASRCRRYVWFWLTPNGTFRPKTGDFRFSATRPDSTRAVQAEGDEQDDGAPGQATWRAAWYFKRGWINFLWHPHPLLYALAALVTAASICILAVSPRQRGLAVFLGLWLFYFSAVTTLAACPEYRYRMVLEPTMIVLVVSAWEHVRAKFGARRRGTLESSEKGPSIK